MSAKSPAIVVYERTGVWTPAVRFAALQQGVRVIETRQIDAALKIALERPMCVIGWEVTADSQRAMVDALDAAAKIPTCYSLILINRDPQVNELAWRQLGAVHVIKSPRNCEAILRIAKKAFVGVTAPSGNIEDRILAQLPWADFRV